jgi:hypothetical protein
MFKRILICGAVPLIAIFGAQLSATEDCCIEKEIAGVNWNFNVGVFGCPGGCYGPAPYYGNPYYCGPYYVPYPGPYYYGCRPYPFWY